MGTETQVEGNRRKGGFRTMPFIIVNESFERVANCGLQSNMIIYLMTYFNMSAVFGTNILGIWNAFSNGLAIVGAVVADSYWGRFRAVAFGSISTLIGMIILWLTAMIPQLTSLSCSHFQHVCNVPRAVQLAVLFSSLGFMSVGTGFIRPCSIMFGADQLENKENPDNQRLIESYFNWYYASMGISSILAVTSIVYIQDHYGWKVGFGVPAILMFLSVLLFLIGSPLYIKVKAKVSEDLVIGLLQAAVAAFRKRNTLLPSTDCDDYFRWPLKSEVLTPSKDLSCLNRACIVQDPQRDLSPDGSASNPWSLSSVEQVESLKALIRVLPMWSTCFMIFVNMNVLSFSLLQLKTMDRHMLPHFEIPAASFGVFMIIATTIWLILYDRVLVPLLSKYTGDPKGLRPVTRMGIGLIASSISMALSAIIESIRRQRAIEEGQKDDPNALVNMSAMWFVPQYVLLGVADATTGVGQIEFFYALLPKSMSSIASAMYTSGIAVASLIGSILVSGVDWLSSTGGKTSWLSSNINRGHLDYYFWLLAFLGLLNFLYFLLVCRLYEPSNVEEREYCHDYYRWPLESEFLTPSKDLSCLNRACIVQDPQRDLSPDGSASNPWSLSSVEQVESLKALIRVLPMWSTCFMIFVNMNVLSFSLLQLKTMDRHMLPHFEIPAASFGVFMIIATTIWLILYDRVLVPLLSKYTGDPKGLRPVTRMGIGLIASSISMALSAIIESIRRQRAIEEGQKDDPNALVNMSAMWFVPQYVLLGVADATTGVGQIEFFYALLPKSMSSIASAMYTSGIAVASLIGSILVSGVDWLSSTGGKTSWLSSNINRGHLDYYFWLLAFLGLLNFLYFLLVCRLYEPSNVEEKECDYTLLPESSSYVALHS